MATTTVAKQQDDDEVMRAALKRAAKEGWLEEPVIYHAVARDMGIDPFAPLNIAPLASKVARARERRRAGALTARVWNSLDSNGQVKPDQAVPLSAVNTGELPVITAPENTDDEE